ncbi:Golgi membrane protein 1, partial [Silurus asotus]
MMGSLVNVRRGGRAPPLFLVALVACILLLGFNYWVSSSKNVELQTKLLELEEALRRTSAEKAEEQVGRSEVEEQLRRQREQLALMEAAHQRRQHSVQSLCKQEKEGLLLNISSTAKTVQDMKNQMISLREDVSKVQKELQLCQNNMNTLNKKLTYDMTQCNTQILAQKEECDEKVAAAKLEVQKKYEKRSVATGVVQKSVISKPEAEMLIGNDLVKSPGGPLKIDPAPGNKNKTKEQLETNEIPEDKKAILLNVVEKKVRYLTLKCSEVKVSLNRNTLVKYRYVKTLLYFTVHHDSEKLPELPPSPQMFQNSTMNNALEGVMDIKGGDLKDADTLFDVAAVTKVKEEDAIEYDNEGEIEKRLSKLKDDKGAAQEFEDELADYNGDDENEPEFEADKQEELAEV